MKLLSILRLSLHSLWNNKIRTLLTVIVLTVVSFVVILLSAFGYSMYVSTNQSISKKLNEQGLDFSVNSYYKYMVNSGNNSWENRQRMAFSLSDIDKMLKIIDAEGTYVSSVSFNTNSSSYIREKSGSGLQVYPFYAKSNPFLGTENYLDSGRMWDASDASSNNIWLHVSMKNKYSLGEKITLEYEEGSGMTQQSKSRDFTVAGFLDVNNPNSWSNDTGLAYIPYSQFNSDVSKHNNPSLSSEGYYNYVSGLYIYDIYCNMIPAEGYTYGAETQNHFKNMIAEINAIPLTKGEFDIRCQILEELKFSLILAIILIAVILVVSSIIILLSIGSVANTVKISAEQNRKFFGVMKAIGMKNKSLRYVLIGQIIIMTLLAIVISSLIALAFLPILSSLLETILYSTYGKFAVVAASISPVISLLIGAMLMGFVLLFTRSNLSSFSKMDVITVINEVN